MPDRPERRRAGRSRRGLARRSSAALAIAAALLTGCGAASGGQGGHQPPRDGTAGLQLSGTFEGRQVAVSDGAPALLLADGCQRAGLAAAVCFRSRDIDGRDVLVAVLNPVALRAGESLAVGGDGCRGAGECAEVRDVAVVEVAIGGRRQRATSGRVDVRALEAGARYAGTVTLAFRDGRLAGLFDVVPLPEEVRPAPGG